MYTVPPALVPFVYVPGLAYEALVRLRNRLYSSARLRQYRLEAPVISIGNLTLGGSGKTPLVICVAQTLVRLGYTPAILTRGYRRSESRENQIIVSGESVPNAAETVGDEPALIRRHVPAAWLGISKNRLDTGKKIASQNPNVIFILDDGFQHRRLHRDLDIVIIDQSQPLNSNRVFPRGTLREPVSALQRCDMIVVHGSAGGKGFDFADSWFRDVTRRLAVVHCKQKIQSLVPFFSWAQHRADSPATDTPTTLPQSAYLVSAIGNPERFHQDIRQLGIGGPGATFFPDHHRLSRKEWRNCVERARRKGADAIIITEKDAVKISEPPDFPLLVAVQTTELADSGTLEKMLKRRIEGRL